jgi:UDP-2,4-diacetamido-2,4,6-trideoxy-beta-L-altropyranose hydrolase
MINPSAKTLTAREECPLIKSKNVWIRTAAGPRIGFGHLRRCLVLAQALRDCCTPVFLLDSNDSWSLEQLSGRGWKSYLQGLDEVWSFLPAPAFVLIDTREVAGLDHLITTAKNRGIPVLSIHDLGLNPLPSDIAIDGSIMPFAGDVPRDATCFSGTDFMVLDPAYGRLQRQSKQIREKIRSVFINLGGGDSERYFLKVLEGLHLWSRELEVIGAPGFTGGIQKILDSRNWSPVRVRCESNHIEQFLFHADLAITAGGLAAYESLCAGTPLLSLSYDPLQQTTISKLAAAGACIDLGRGETLEHSKLLDVLSRIDSDPGLRRRLSARGRQVVDGRGAERVSQIIRQSIFMHSNADNWRASDVSGVGL